MKSSLLKNILLVGRIILPAILCVIFALILKKTYWEYLVIAIFGVVIMVFNYGKNRYGFILSLLISVIFSYLVFFLSIILFGGFNFLLTGGNPDKQIIGVFLGADVNTLIILLPIAIISPLLMFYAYRVLFYIKRTKYFRVLKWSSVTILIIIGIIRNFYNNNNLYIYWQFIMALALQLILYQKELKALFKPKNR